MAWTIVNKEEAAEFLGTSDQTVIKDIWSEIIEGLIFDHWKHDYSSQTYTEYYDGTGTNHLRLRNTPITSVDHVKFLDNTGEYLSVASATIKVYNYYIKLTTGVATEDDPTFPKGVKNVEVKYTAGTTTIPQSLKMAELHSLLFIWRFTQANLGDDSIRFGNAPEQGGQDRFRRGLPNLNEIDGIIRQWVPTKLKVGK